MKLYLLFSYVALLSIGIMPVAVAMPGSLPDKANLTQVPNYAEDELRSQTLVTVQGVRLNPTPNGLEVILETAGKLQVSTSSRGYTAIADIPNAQLRLPDGSKLFRAINPVEGIAVVTVTQQNANSVRVIVTGNQAVPTAQVIPRTEGLVLNLTTPPATADAAPAQTTRGSETPAAQQPEGETEQPASTEPEIEIEAESETAQQPEGETEQPASTEPEIEIEAESETAQQPEGETEQPASTEPEIEIEAESEAETEVGSEGDENIEIVVTGEQEEEGYSVPDASTATRTDTPLRDIPQSIQVVPEQVIEDQQVTELEEALRNVSGVTFGGDVTSRGEEFNIRGFDNVPILRDGFRRYGSFGTFPEVANLERIEVLKGPASILYGEIQPGGLINLVSKKPLAEPFYEAELQVGNWGFIRPRIDVSELLTDDGRLRYRLNALYQKSNSFRGFDQEDKRFFISPVLSWKISPSTDLTVSLEYTNDKRPADIGLPAFGDEVVDVPRDRIANEPDDKIERKYLNVGYDLEHRFNDNWKLRNAFRYSSYDYDYNVLAYDLGDYDDETGILNRFFASQEGQDKNYALQTNLVGEVATGSIAHTLLFGVDLSRNNERIVSAVGDTSPLNIFNPVYGQIPKPDEDTIPSFGGDEVETDRLGIYLQDQISLLDNVKLLAGLRYDTAEQKTTLIPGTSTLSGEQTRNYDALTPRVGIVYQPIEELSLYTSYSRSFNPNTGTTISGDPLEPEKGEGYEVGVKAQLLDRLFATLAYFDITKQNVAVTDPLFPLDASIATGEQQSRGVELDVAGEILPGWNIIAAYAYIDAEVTADTNPDIVGNRLFNVPKHSASLWTTYEIQSGNLQGLGFGVGFNYVGEREGDLDNSFQVDSYFLTNASIFYRRNNWRFALNFKNLFDINYIEAAENSRSSGNLPGDPFTVIGSVSVEF
jgi:iron complex outermembrane receptor protein